MSFDKNIESGCNITLLASQLTHKINKNFPNQYNVIFYRHLAKYVPQDIYDQMIKIAFRKYRRKEKRKKISSIQSSKS